MLRRYFLEKDFPVAGASPGVGSKAKFFNLTNFGVIPWDPEVPQPSELEVE